MLEIKPLSRYLFVAALVAGGAICPSIMVHADDSNGGYAGLFAPASTPDNTQGESSGTSAKPSPVNSGYEGLIAGPTAEQPPQEQQQTPPQTAAVPPSPFDEPVQPLQPAQMAPQNIDIASVIANAPKIKRIKVDFSGLKPDKVKGMPSMEYATEQAIKTSFARINDTSLSVKERLKNARQAYQDLSSIADGLRAKLSVPYSIYKGMGLSDSYIREVRNGNIASLRTLNTALQSLRPYQ